MTSVLFFLRKVVSPLFVKGRLAPFDVVSCGAMPCGFVETPPGLGAERMTQMEREYESPLASGARRKREAGGAASTRSSPPPRRSKARQQNGAAANAGGPAVVLLLLLVGQGQGQGQGMGRAKGRTWTKRTK